MKRYMTFVATSVALALLFVLSCEESPVEPEKTEQASSISGYVRDSLNQPIFGAIVVDNGQMGKTDTTDQSGAYKLEYTLKSEYKTKLIVYATGYYRDTAEVTLSPGGTVTQNFQLKRDWGQSVVIGSPKPAANIKLLSVSDRSIAIRGTGLKDYCILQFQITDSSGNPLVGSNKATVRFSLLSGPQGGEYISPDSVDTDNNGMVTTTVWSGTKAGIVQVNATTRNGEVKAMPVTITITGGYPDGQHFSLSSSQYNVAGQLWDNLTVPIMVVVGDRYGNPPVPSVVKFTTTAGIITGSAITNEFGIATATLITTDPRPANGRVYVTATTVGDSTYRPSDSLISRSILIAFTGKTRIVAPTTTLIVPDSGSVSFAYKVSDENGFPLVAGSTITVRITDLLGNQMSSVQVLGDVNVTMKDTYDTSKTNYSVTLVKTSRVAPGGPAKVVIDVKTPQYGNGDATSEISAYVMSTSVSGGSAGFAKRPYTIELLSIERTTLQVAESGTQGTSATRMTFVVKDSLGNRIVNFANSGIPRTYVAFSLVPSTGLGGGEYFIPSIDSLNDNGEVSTVFRAGTRSGLIRVAATVVGHEIAPAYVDIAIYGGYPDENRVVVKLDKENYPGLVTTEAVGTVSVQLSDQYNNPVRPNTPIYLTTTGGQIQPVTMTDAIGKATAVLYGGGQVPNDGGNAGYGQVILRTYGRDSVVIQRTLPFIFSGKPIVGVYGLSGDSVKVNSGSFVVVNYKVADENNNPIASGNRIRVTVRGTSAVSVSGHVDVTTVDTRDTTATWYQVVVSGGGVSEVTPFEVKIEVSGPNGTAEKVLKGVLYPQNAVATTGQTPYSIEVASVERTTLQVMEGGTEPTTFSKITFVVKDSLGNRLVYFTNSGVPRTQVQFSLVPSNGLGGGEQVLPLIDSVSNNGEVSTIFRSGSKAGIVRVAASIVGANRPPAYQDLVIYGGYPDSARVVARLDKENYPGLVTTSQVGVISIQLGDQFNNPARPNTPIYLTATGGKVQPLTTTDEKGEATAILYGGGQIPNDGGKPGYGQVILTTYGKDSTVIQRSLPFLFSGKPIITVNGSQSDSIQLYSGDAVVLNYKVADENRNPLSAGNRITVKVTGTAANFIGLAGDYSVTTVDTKDTNYTNYQVILTGGEITSTSTFDLYITVDGPNGSTTKRFYGTLYPSGTIIPPSVESKQPAQIAFISISRSSIYVAGTGGIENSVITYEVRDSLGSPIKPSQDVIVKFALSFLPSSYNVTGSYPELLPDSAKVDNNGRVKVLVYSGTCAGVVQVRSWIELPDGRVVISEPVKIQVHAGFPDQNHFTVGARQRNFPGLDKAFVENQITVQVGDMYSNPVAQGTAVRFETWHGTITTGGLTDANGFVSQTLWSANPFPVGANVLPGYEPGYSYVKVMTQGQNGATVQDSIILLWTGEPIITKTRGPQSFTIDDGAFSDSVWEFTVYDRFNHPMSAGTRILIDAPGARVHTNADVTLGDTFNTGDGITNFYVMLEDGNPNDTDPNPKPCPLKVVVIHPVYGTFSLTLAIGLIQ